MHQFVESRDREPDQPEGEVKRDPPEEERIEAVEHAAVTAQCAAGIFHVCIPLERAFDETPACAATLVSAAMNSPATT